MGLFDFLQPSPHKAAPASPAAPMPDKGYDRLAVPSEDGVTRFMTRSEFQKLALVDRVRLLAGGRLRFFRGDEEIAPGEALRT